MQESQSAARNVGVSMILNVKVSPITLRLQNTEYHWWQFRSGSTCNNCCRLAWTSESVNTKATTAMMSSYIEELFMNIIRRQLWLVLLYRQKCMHRIGLLSWLSHNSQRWGKCLASERIRWLVHLKKQCFVHSQTLGAGLQRNLKPKSLSYTHLFLLKTRIGLIHCAIDTS